jgi:hypothetical protein
VIAAFEAGTVVDLPAKLEGVPRWIEHGDGA